MKSDQNIRNKIENTGSSPSSQQFWEYQKRLNVFRQTKSCCLVVDKCTDIAINAHSVPRSFLSGMAEEGHVIKLAAKYRATDVEFQAEQVGIKKASVGRFACQKHDAEFAKIDHPFELSDQEALNLVVLRAVLKEISVLESSIQSMSSQMRKIAYGISPLGNEPTTRLRSMQDLRRQIIQCLDPSKCKCGSTCKIKHITRKIKTDQAIVAGSSANGAYDSAHIEYKDGTTEISRDYLINMRIEPNAAWGFSVFPMKDSHAVVMSFLRNSNAQRYFDHIKEANGRELEEAVSIELIRLCDNWMISPHAWNRYGSKKQGDILTAFQNIPDILQGKYSFVEERNWWEELGISNRRRLNLFRY